jgi:hypothetical protein
MDHTIRGGSLQHSCRRLHGGPLSGTESTRSTDSTVGTCYVCWTYRIIKRFDNASNSKHRKTQVELNKPIFTGQAVLDMRQHAASYRCPAKPQTKPQNSELRAQRAQQATCRVITCGPGQAVLQPPPPATPAAPSAPTLTPAACRIC